MDGASTVRPSGAGHTSEVFSGVGRFPATVPCRPLSRFHRTRRFPALATYVVPSAESAGANVPSRSVAVSGAWGSRCSGPAGRFPSERTSNQTLLPSSRM
ncbi:hypothetical protein SF12_15025 [Streptomyces sp. MBRL 601]|nr:hypothetical protein SF12_15025 [Streptomyces sp. MBRL 601]